MAETKTTEVAKASQPSFSVALTETLEENKMALPKDFNIPRFVQNGVALMNSNKELQDYAKQYGTAQIKQGMMRAAYLGLDFINKEAHLVKFGNDLNFMVGYKGAEKLVKKYSQRPVLNIDSKVVREGDEFEEGIINGQPTINFKPLPFNNAPIIGAFAYINYVDGGMQYDTMSLADLENTRNHAKAKNSPAWTGFTSEMYRKTVLNRLCKHITIDFENAEQYSIFMEDSEIETDPKEQAKTDIEQTATEEFVVDSTMTEVQE